MTQNCWCNSGTPRPARVELQVLHAKNSALSTCDMPKNPALGITLAVIGCCCTALGYALQKIGHTRAQRYNALRQGDVDAAVGGAGKSSEAEDQDGARHEHDAHHHHKHISYWRFWHFWAGISCLVVGAIFSVVVFGLAGQVRIARRPRTASWLPHETAQRSTTRRLGARRAVVA